MPADSAERAEKGYGLHFVIERKHSQLFNSVMERNLAEIVKEAKDIRNALMIKLK